VGSGFKSRGVYESPVTSRQVRGFFFHGECRADVEDRAHTLRNVASSNKQRIADQRREKLERIRLVQRRRERRRWILIASAIGLVAVVLAVIVVVLVTRPQSGPPAEAGAERQIIPEASTGATTVQLPVTTVPDASGIPGVLAWDTTGWPGDGGAHTGALEHQHVDGPVTYTVTPPVGGPHNGIWMNAGVYTKPIPSERAVHNMEHGAVWITYEPDLPASEVAALTAFVTQQSLIPETGETATGAATTNSNRYVDLSPWATKALPAPIVVSAWGHQLRLTSATDPRMQTFVDTFRNSATYSPEYGAAADGIPIQTGGRPASAGSSEPNPPGAVQ